MNKTEQRLAELREEEKALLKELDRQRGRKLFRCACGKGHMIKDLFLTEFYASGADHEFQEYRIDCPDRADLTNRLLWDTVYHVQWEVRDHYDHNARSQFRRMYSHLFKKVPVEHRFGTRSMSNPTVYDGSPEDPKKPWVNNYSIDHSHTYWSIKLKDFDYDRFNKNLADKRRIYAIAVKNSQKIATPA